MNTSIEPRNVKLKTVEKALTILEILAERSVPLSLTQIVQITKLSFSTAYRLMNTLWLKGFVERENNTDFYKLGLKAVLVGNAAMQNIELRPIALPYLNQLAQICGESIFLAIFFNQNVIYFDCVKTPGPIQIGIQIGVPIPACRTSSGRVLLSNLPLSEQQSLAEIYFQDKLISDKDKFLVELKRIKFQGFCSMKSDYGGMIYEISFPIYNYFKVCIGTVSVFLSSNQKELSEQEDILLRHIKKTSLEISRAMGYSPSQ
jgi:DNA-binding IclR family transcriptional regulator